MANFDTPLRLLLKRRRDGKYFALVTPAVELTAATGMPAYTKRWRIENFFAENTFLGVDRLPSLNLNAIQTMLSLRLLAALCGEDAEKWREAEAAAEAAVNARLQFWDGVLNALPSQHAQAA